MMIHFWPAQLEKRCLLGRGNSFTFVWQGGSDTFVMMSRCKLLIFHRVLQQSTALQIHTFQFSGVFPNRMTIIFDSLERCSPRRPSANCRLLANYRKTVPQENDDSRAVVRQRSGVAAVSCVVQLLALIWFNHRLEFQK